MDVMGEAEARRRLGAVIERAVEDRVETVIVRPDGAAVVVVAKKEWDAVRETLHVLSSSVNARRLWEAVGQLEAGGGTNRDLINDGAVVR
jgi:antitoxin YefM